MPHCAHTSLSARAAAAEAPSVGDLLVIRQDGAGAAAGGSRPLRGGADAAGGCDAVRQARDA
eukprot:5188092-Prymnesium_polylepis.1